MLVAIYHNLYNLFAFPLTLQLGNAPLFFCFLVFIFIYLFFLFDSVAFHLQFRPFHFCDPSTRFYCFILAWNAVFLFLFYFSHFISFYCVVFFFYFFFLIFCPPRFDRQSRISSIVAIAPLSGGNIVRQSVDWKQFDLANNLLIAAVRGIAK